MKDLEDRLTHTQESNQDLIVQETARSNVTASLPIGQAHVEPITSSLPIEGGGPTEEAYRPHSQGEKTLFAEADSSKREIEKVNDSNAPQHQTQSSGSRLETLRHWIRR